MKTNLFHAACGALIMVWVMGVGAAPLFLWTASAAAQGAIPTHPPLLIQEQQPPRSGPPPFEPPLPDDGPYPGGPMPDGDAAPENRQGSPFLEGLRRFFGGRDDQSNEEARPAPQDGGGGCTITEEELQEFFDQYEMM